MELFQEIVHKDVDCSKFSPKLKDLLKKLFIKDRKNRIGHQGAKEIKQHPWFEKINWESITKKKVKAPFVPVLTS